MAKKTKKSSEFDYQKMPVPQIYSNSLGIGHSDTEVVINFGFSTPTYFEPHDDEDIPVARVVLSWEVAEDLLTVVRAVLKEHKKPQRIKRNVKSKTE
jgi:hypothetical protein